MQSHIPPAGPFCILRAGGRRSVIAGDRIAGFVGSRIWNGQIFLRSSRRVLLSAAILLGFFFAGVLYSGVGRSAIGDEIKLRRGGSLTGKIVKSPDENGGFYEIQLDNGAVLKIAKREVDTILAPQAAVQSYQEELGKHDLATVEGQMEMVRWCQANKLRVQKTKHLRAVIGLDPDHEEARRLLGYTRHRLTGKWVLREEYYQSIGYIRSGTAMRLPQGKLVEEEEAKHRQAVIGWRTNINRWVTLLKNPRRFAEAKQELTAIKDPKAIPAITDLYERLSKKRTRTDFDRQVQGLLIEIVSRIDILSARLFLANIALADPDPDLRDEAERILVEKEPSWLASYLISRLNRIMPSSSVMVPDGVVVAERDFISRAAVILKELSEKTDVSEAILPLIRLVYIQRILPPLAAPKKGGLGGASFSKDGGIAMNQGKQPTKPRNIQIGIEQAKTTLIKLTEQRYEYDKEAWLRWYLSRTLPQQVDLRRLDD